MKIRSDFVTNSSSSSYINIYFECDIIDEYLKSNNKTHKSAVGYQESYVGYEKDPIYSSDAAKKPSEILVGYYDWLNCFYEDCGYPYNELDESEDVLNSEEIEDLVKFIKENQDKIDSSLSMKINVDARDTEEITYFNIKEYSVQNGHGTYKEIMESGDEIICSRGNVPVNKLEYEELNAYTDVYAYRKTPSAIKFLKKYGKYIEF